MNCKGCDNDMEYIREYPDSSIDTEYMFYEYQCAKCGWIAIIQQCTQCEHEEVTWEK